MNTQQQTVYQKQQNPKQSPQKQQFQQRQGTVSVTKSSTHSQPFKGNFHQKQQQGQNDQQLQYQHQQQQQQQIQFSSQPISSQNPQNGEMIMTNNVQNSNGFPQQNGNVNGQVNNQMQSNQVSNTGKYKTNICRHYQNGNCQLGTTCHFAHGQEEIRTSSDPVPQNIPQLPKVVYNNFKTVKCRFFEKGHCKNQNACCFAHGDNDLSTVYQSDLMGQLSPQMMIQQQPQQNKVTDALLLIVILQNLEQVFTSDATIIQYLRYAQQIAKNGDQKGAFNIISDIMRDQKRTEEEKSQYNTICGNAQMYYSYYHLYLDQGALQSQVPNQFVQPDQQVYYSPAQFSPNQALPNKQRIQNFQEKQYINAQQMQAPQQTIQQHPFQSQQ